MGAVKYTTIFWVFASLLNCLQAADLDVQYRAAFEFAFFQHEGRYYRAARRWAREYIEKKGELAPGKTLLRHFQDALDLAVSPKGIGMERQEAQQWAGELLLSRYRNAGDKNLAIELAQFLNEAQFPDFNADKWCLQFLRTSTPLYSSTGIDARYREMYDFLRRRPEFAYSLEKAEQAALKFIVQRYRFAHNRSLFQQYTDAYRFAVDRLGLPFEECRVWAIGFVTQKGALPDFEPLDRQYRQAYMFARAGQGLSLSHEDAKNWAIAYLENKGQSLTDRPLTEQYQQAYIFAYTGDFLDILVPHPAEKNAPRNLFLHDKAADWARTFITARGYSAKGPGKAYLDALIFAYSSEGMRMNMEEAKQWAEAFIERPLPE